MKRAAFIVLILLVVAGGGAYLFRQEFGLSSPADTPAQAQGQSRRGGRGGRGGGGGEGGPVSVLTEASRLADVPVILEAIGTAQALNTATVRAQVDGRLVEVAFREGQDVKKGDVLARIDPTIYRAQYDQAVARKAQNEANLANARLDLQRYVQLASTNAGSKKQEDTQRAAVAQLEAQVQADQGAIDSAKAYLDYTTITAPIAGRAGLRQVDQGNLVRAGDQSGIVSIAQLKPISVIFNLPQQDLRAVNAAAARGPLTVEALESDNRTAIDAGRLEVVDNQVDAATGTVRLKAVFPNDNLQLWPGSFVNVRLTVDVTRNAVVVPSAAVQRGPNGAFVFGVEGGKAVLKPVTVARQTEALAVITSGLTPPERVITTGFGRLTDGNEVRVADAEAPALRGEAPTAARGDEGSGGGPLRERRRRPERAEATTGEGATNQRASDQPSGGAGTGPGRTGSTAPDGERRRRRETDGRAAERPGPRASSP